MGTRFLSCFFLSWLLSTHALGPSELSSIFCPDKGARCRCPRLLDLRGMKRARPSGAQWDGHLSGFRLRCRPDSARTQTVVLWEWQISRILCVLTPPSPNRLCQTGQVGSDNPCLQTTEDPVVKL
jgi:hypothetical protein